MPFKMSNTTFVVPLVEEALFGEYCLQGTFFHKDMASIIFQSKIYITTEKLLHWLPLITNLREIFYLCSKHICTVSQYFEENIQIIMDEETHAPAWSPTFFPIKSFLSYSLWVTVWLRVNCANAFNQRNPKIQAYLNAHLPLIRYLDSLDNPNDLNINHEHFYSLYGDGVGKTTFDVDRNYIKTDHRLTQIRLYPLEVIQKYYPKLPWYPEQVQKITENDVKRIQEAGYDIKPASWRSFQYYACLYIMVQCKDLHKLNEHNSNALLDALWFYHACFLDYFCGNDPTLNASTYPHDNNAFMAYDLPDVFHILMNIPTRGEKVELPFLLGKFIQKTLPYAGARRTLSDKIDDALNGDDAFWKILSHLIYCLQNNMYPYFLASKRDFNLQKLCNVKKTVLGDRKILKNHLKNNPKACYIIFTSFRMWILLMVREQKHYLNVIMKYVDWNDFKNRSMEMAAIIQKNEKSSLITDNKHAKIYRYRDNNCIKTVLKILVTTLEKTVYACIDQWKNENLNDYPTNIQIYVKEMNKELETTVKVNLLNCLVKVDRKDWLKTPALSIMKYHGNISDHSLYLIDKLIHIYYDSAKPKDFEAVVELFNVADLRVVCWYFRVIDVLNNIDFELLTQNQVQNINYAIAVKKYMLYPGQPIPDAAYNIYISICCGKIKSLQGKEKYGHEHIAYDLEKQIYVCSKTPKKIISYTDEEYGFDDMIKKRKLVRSQRKEFNYIPCVNNPVLIIPIQGYMLIYKRKYKYLHCPSCGSFHQFNTSGYKNDSYACQECRTLEQSYYYTCHICSDQIPESYAKFHTLTKMDPTPIHGPRDIFQKLYYCKKHYKKEKNKNYILF